MHSTSKMKAILERIQRVEAAISKGREYLESGAHANWRGFRPLFTAKMRDGKNLPPHKDWIKNVFLPSRERALRYLEKLLVQLEDSSAERINNRRQRRSISLPREQDASASPK